MTQAKVISADSHVMEPSDFWETRLDRKYRDNAPRVVPKRNGKGYVFIAPEVNPFPVAGGFAAGRSGDELKDFSGLSFRHPFAAFAMLLFMLSLGGIPPTAGFMGKFWLFSAAVDAGYYGLAVIGVLNSAISLYYYVRIVVFMYLKKETVGSVPVSSPSLTVALALAVVATIVLGVYPRLLFDIAESSARTLGVAGVTAAIR